MFSHQSVIVLPISNLIGISHYNCSVSKLNGTCYCPSNIWECRELNGTPWLPMSFYYLTLQYFSTRYSFVNTMVGSLAKIKTQMLKIFPKCLTLLMISPAQLSWTLLEMTSKEKNNHKASKTYLVRSSYFSVPCNIFQFNTNL